MLIPELSPSAGLGLKPEHFRSALDAHTGGLWFEIHPENYMTAGGPRLAWLEAICAKNPLSIHAIGLSLGGNDPLDKNHLNRIKTLVDRFKPVLVSEHMAWSSLDQTYYPDLLPPLLNQASLDRFCEHVDQVQTVLGRTILLENPSHYMPFKVEIPEAEFLTEIVSRTGCGLLLDINNIHVSANNLGYDPLSYLDAIPAYAVGEFHLAGFEADTELGDDLLIDTHGAPVSDPVWALFERAVARIGPRPTLIERDNNIPAFSELMQERDRAQAILDRCVAKASAHV